MARINVGRSSAQNFHRAIFGGWPEQDINEDKLVEELHLFLLEILVAKEQAVIFSRFGLGTEAGKPCRCQTQKEIGRMLGVDYHVVHRIEEKALDRIRSPRHVDEVRALYNDSVNAPGQKNN